jgi:NADPH:quinone reductase-like Zn-dependent oxidoreductase
MAMMKAVRIHQYGGPETMQLEEVPVPAPDSNHLLVRVEMAGVNPADYKMREGKMGTKRAMPFTLGLDFAGTVESVGAAVSGYRAREAVFGSALGAYAEYVLAEPVQIARMPEKMSMAAAAATPVAGLTAWQALFDAGGLEAGQTVLIQGGAGGVGSFAVQLAKHQGARVLTTAAAENREYLQQLGADEVIDYHTTRFEDVAHNIDLVLDLIGGETQARSWQVLKPGGTLISTVQPPDEAQAKAHQARGQMIVRKNNPAELGQLAQLIADGRIKVRVETVLPLAEARKALAQSESGHTRGKIVLQVAPPTS